MFSLNFREFQRIIKIKNRIKIYLTRFFILPNSLLSLSVARRGIEPLFQE